MGIMVALKRYVESYLHSGQNKASCSIAYHDSRILSPGSHQLVFIAVPFKSITTETIRHWIPIFDVAVQLYSNNGTHFSSSLFREVCSSLGIP
jgi:transposase InsO family protein